MTKHPLASGSTLGPHYAIDELIGEGGMGVVYRGRDTRLGRSVALKILSGTSLENPDALHRFEREARTASSLNHPNIVTIHEVGEADGVAFIAQEFVTGETLRHRLAGGRMAEADAIGVAIQVASALDAAHAAGVVHRDIKPENIMLRPDGIVKVLDFGLAKQAPAADARSADAITALPAKTRTGMVLGTVRYMSPEQARGLPVDARSDVFSLGAVIYEMVAGRSPFGGQTSSDVLVSILSDDPPPLAVAAPQTSAELQRIVAKTLRKQADERYQSVKDLLVDLKTLKAGAGVPAPGPARSAGGVQKKAAGVALLAVLAVAAAGVGFRFFTRTPVLTSADTILLADFVNTTGETVFDGGTLKQGLTVQLQQTPFLNLFPDQAIATTLAMMDRKPDERVTGAIAREICQRNGLKALVSGTIARLGQQYVITLEAVHAQTGATIAIQQGEAPDAEHVLRTLGATATGLRGRLGETLGTLQRYNAPIEQATTPSLEALKAYSAGIALIQREDGRAALPFFERAVALDPDFVAAYDNGAWAHAMSGTGRAPEWAAQAYQRRQRSTELEQLSAAATYHHFATGDLDEENRVYAVWTRLFPNDWSTQAGFAFNYPVTGRLDAAAEASRAIIRLSPNIAQGYRFLAMALVPLHRFDEAQRAIDDGRARRLDNGFLRRSQLALALASNDAAKTAQALDALRRNEGEGEATGWRARLASFDGRWREGRDLFRQTLPAAQRAVATASLPLEAVGVEALFGFCRAGEDRRALALSRIVEPAASYIPIIGPDGSLCGDPSDADRFADELARKFPSSTVAREISLPQLRAAAALKRNQPEQAIEALRSFRAVGPCSAGICTNDGFRGWYLKGEAYLRQGNSAEASAAFQTILDHRGWGPASPIYPVAYRGLARAAALAGDAARARQAYENLFALWKNADSDLPVLMEARKEYAALAGR